MLNKFIKLIHNKYSKFFRFIFFLRYLIVIFFASSALFLIVPQFFDHDKKIEVIKDHLFQNYNLRIKNYNKIEFKPMPLPKFEIKDVFVELKSTKEKVNVKDLILYPNLLGIYNNENFRLKKIVLKNSNINLHHGNLNFFIKQLFNPKKLSIDNLDLKILDQNQSIISLENIKFNNFGYNKNLIIGKIFDKKFKTKISNNFEDISIVLLNSGISADINFDKNQKLDFTSGTFKSKILNTNLRFNFNYNDDQIEIYNSFFRNKKLSFSNQSLITLKPFLDLDSKLNVDEFDPEIFEIFNFDKLSEYRNIIKKINSKNEINLRSKKFSQNLFNEMNLKINLAYGRVSFAKKILIDKDFFLCEGNVNLMEDYPLLFFDCSIIINDKKKFLKKLSIRSTEKNIMINLNVKGNLNILNKKINFTNIKSKNNYKASKEDLKYFKNSFENVFFEKSFLQIFNLNIIKDFILEIS